MRTWKPRVQNRAGTVTIDKTQIKSETASTGAAKDHVGCKVAWICVDQLTDASGSGAELEVMAYVN